MSTYSYPYQLDPLWPHLQRDYPTEAELMRLVGDFLEKEAAPNILAWEEKGEAPPEFWRDLEATTRMSAWGYAEEHGGMGLSSVGQMAGAHMTSYYGPDLGVAPGVNSTLGGGALRALASPEQLAHWAPIFADSDDPRNVCFALTEPGAGSSPAKLMKTHGVREGDDFVLNGEKCFISAARQGGYSVVFFKDREIGEHAISAALMDNSIKGVQLSDLLHKRGIPLSETRNIAMQDVRIPMDMILGERGQAWFKAPFGLIGGRIGVTVQATGGGFRLINEIAHAVSVKPLNSHGLLVLNAGGNDQKIVAHLARLRSAMYAAFYAAQAVDLYNASPADMELFMQAVALVSECKYLGPSFANDAARDLIRLGGGDAFMMESNAGKTFADLRITEIYDGPIETMLFDLARVWLGKGLGLPIGS